MWKSYNIGNIYHFNINMHIYQLQIITTKFVSSNPADTEVYSIQHYVIKFVSDLQQVGDFSPITSTPEYNWNIVESGVKYPNPHTQLQIKIDKDENN
jgi:hypothetical protein